MSRQGMDAERVARLYELVAGVIIGFYDREGPPVPTPANPGQRALHSLEVVITTGGLAVEMIGRLPPAKQADAINELLGMIEHGLSNHGWVLNLPRVDNVGDPMGPLQ